MYSDGREDVYDGLLGEVVLDFASTRLVKLRTLRSRIKVS